MNCKRTDGPREREVWQLQVNFFSFRSEIRNRFIATPCAPINSNKRNGFAYRIWCCRRHPPSTIASAHIITMTTTTQQIGFEMFLSEGGVLCVYAVRTCVLYIRLRCVLGPNAKDETRKAAAAAAETISMSFEAKPIKKICDTRKIPREAN